MTYIRNPRHPFVWESDGDEPWGKYKASDGTIHNSAAEADEHDKRRAAAPEEKDLDS